MKKHAWLLIMLTITIVNGQDKKSKAKKDSVKTEVVKVVTSYVPKITDVFKIKQKPVIFHTKEIGKKILDFQIFSVPVASTFVPKSGTLKKINLGKRERLYANYVSAGFGNRMAPFLEGYFRKSVNFDSELAGYVRFLLSQDPVQDAQLNSTFYNLDFNVYHQQTERYFIWKAGLDLQQNKYSWYGLPTKISFNDRVINAIEEDQTYSYFKLFGNIDFDESYIDSANGTFSFFMDGFSSTEMNCDLGVNFKFPLDRINENLSDLSIKKTINYLGGKFENAYEHQEKINYGFFTLGLHPSLEFAIKKLEVRLGAKGFFTFDVGRNINHLLAYPDIEFSYPLVKNISKIYAGVNGSLYNNTYNDFTNDNPFVSPTLDIVQTNETYKAFAGISGKMGQKLGYNLKGSYASIKAQPFFTLNQSKSDGTRTTARNGFFLYGYEYGNSFKVVYDDIQLISFLGEVTFEVLKDLAFGANIQFNQFNLTNIEHPWNVPRIKGELFSSFRAEKWYARTNIFFVGERKGIQFEEINSPLFTSVNIESYIDINFNGGYHFHDDFSVFFNLKNMLNNNYQRYTNFQVQGFQAMAGISWKFDALF